MFGVLIPISHLLFWTFMEFIKKNMDLPLIIQVEHLLHENQNSQMLQNS